MSLPAPPDPVTPDPVTPDPGPPDASDPVLPPSLRFLKWLVILLTLTMIGGVITVVTVLVTRMPQAFAAPTPGLPEGFALPDGISAEAVTFGKGWTLVVTDDDRILIFDRNGTLRQEVVLTP